MECNVKYAVVAVTLQSPFRQIIPEVLTCTAVTVNIFYVSCLLQKDEHLLHRCLLPQVLAPIPFQAKNVFIIVLRDLHFSLTIFLTFRACALLILAGKYAGLKGIVRKEEAYNKLNLLIIRYKCLWN
jgi:hypothetical protein